MDQTQEFEENCKFAISENRCFVVKTENDHILENRPKIKIGGYFSIPSTVLEIKVPLYFGFVARHYSEYFEKVRFQLRIRQWPIRVKKA